MKTMLHRSLLVLALVATAGIASAQNQVYWTESFTNSATVTSDPGSNSSVYTYNGDAGTWTFYGLWTTTGTDCPAPGEASGTNRHIRSTNNTSLGSGTATIDDDTAYAITPAVTNGVQEVRLLRSRSNRRISIWKTADAVPTTTNWILAAVIPKWAGQPTCNDTTVVVNDVNAKQIKLVFERAGNSDIDSVRLTSVTAIPVPVSFGSYSARPEENRVKVSWEILSELNTARYEVERSENGRAFSPAATLEAKGIGSYNWLDATPLKGTSYYRIKAVDKDGSAMYSTIMKVSLEGKGEFTVSPNPVKGNKINLQLANLEKGTYNLTLINAVGQVVHSSKIEHTGGTSSVPVQFSGNIKAGLYSLQLRNGSDVLSKKIVVE